MGFLDVLQERREKPLTVFRVLIPLTKILNIRSLILKCSFIEGYFQYRLQGNLKRVSQEIMDDDKEPRT
jgi:hypothetical protein